MKNLDASALWKIYKNREVITKESVDVLESSVIVCISLCAALKQWLYAAKSFIAMLG